MRVKTRFYFMFATVDCESWRARAMPQVAFAERGVPAVHGHVSAGTHRDAHVGLGLCVGVVDPVARNRDPPAFRANRRIENRSASQSNCSSVSVSMVPTHTRPWQERFRNRLYHGCWFRSAL